jgi:hypothetical protein
LALASLTRRGVCAKEDENGRLKKTGLSPVAEEIQNPENSLFDWTKNVGQVRLRRARTI